VSKATPEAVKALLLKKRLETKRGEKSARQVREALIAALEHDAPPDSLDPQAVSLARKAPPHGPFPSHRTLMLIFEHEL
jgi:hypothetical protein